MNRRSWYVLCAVVLSILFSRAYSRIFQLRSISTIELPSELTGESCENVFRRARQLAQDARESARPAYLWFVTHCEDSPDLPSAMHEAGSLLGHFLQRPDEARQVYEEFLLRFPTHPQAADANYHLAKLEIDAGDYAAAVGHLSALAQRFPESPHAESAKFLATKAAEKLAADRNTSRTLLRHVIPNNPVSFMVVLAAAIGPVVLDWTSRARNEGRWLVPTVVIALTALNFVINNVEAIHRNTDLIAKFSRLAASDVQGHEDGQR